MKIVIASDHAGFKTKESIKVFLKSLKHEVVDLGPSSEAKVDYPDFAKLVAKEISEKKAELGVLVCGSGIGMCMTANRFKNVRAVVINDEFDAEMSRKHNNANVACFGSRKSRDEEIERLLKVWIGTSFDGNRHEKRVGKIEL